MLKPVLLLYFFLIATFAAYSQGYRQTVYQTENGLPTNLARAAIQDGQGFVWVATEEGIARFDGRNFINFKKELPSSNARSFFQTRDGKLLAITDLGIVEIVHKSRYPMADSMLFKPYLKGHSHPDSAQVYYPKAIFQDCKDNLWISEYNAVVAYRNKKLKRYTFEDQYHSQDFSRSFCFFETTCGQLMVSSNQGALFRYLADKDTFELLDTHSAFSRINSIIKTPSGKIWIGDEQGVFEVDFDDNASFIAARKITPLTMISCLAVDAEGNIFAGTTFNGLFKIEIKEEEIIARKIDTFFFKVINNIYVDKDKSLWISCDEGLALVQPAFMRKLPLVQQTPYIESLSYSANKELLVAEGTNIHAVRKAGHDYVSTIVHRASAPVLSLLYRRDTLFVGTNDLPPLHYLKNSKSYTIDLGIFDRSIFSLYQDKQENIWMTQYSPIGVVSKLTPDLKIKHYKSAEGIYSRIHVVRQAPDGTIYCGSESAVTYLYRYNKNKDRFEYINLPLPFKVSPNFIINDICFDNRGMMWLASNQGLMTLHDRKLSLVDLGEKFTYENIKAIFPGKNGRIWIGTNLGLIEYYGDQYFLFEEANGLPTKTISPRGILEDENETLWVATAGGLAYSQHRSGEIKFTQTPLIIELKVNGKPFSTDQPNSVFPYHSYLEANFASLTYPADKVLYQYRVAGVQEQWSKPEYEARIFIPQLPQGTYTLEIRAKQQGNYSWSKPLQWTFSIENAWYRTLWALGGYVLSFLLLISAVLRLNTRRLNRQKEKLERIVAQRTQEIILQRDEIAKQKLEIEKQNQEIRSSIVYSRRIQDAMLPDTRKILKVLPETFIFHQPRDIVSGDFYWFAEKHGKYLMAAADCTGHGVPGALMSMIAHDKLHQIVNESNTTQPDVILSRLDKAIIAALRQQDSDFQDGLDIALISIDTNTATLSYAGAKNPMYYFEQGEFKELKASRASIGEGTREEKQFSLQSISYRSGDCMLYLFSDGFRDQFGGTDDSKYTSRRFKVLLQEIHTLPVSQQSERVRQEFVQWKGNYEQTDDVLIIGIRL